MMDSIETGQLSIFDISMDFKDTHVDRYGRKHEVPSWMRYERCENCEAWNMYPTHEQPPEGWGVFGWCTCKQYKAGATSYCNLWEDKNRM